MALPGGKAGSAPLPWLLWTSVSGRCGRLARHATLMCGCGQPQAYRVQPQAPPGSNQGGCSLSSAESVVGIRNMQFESSVQSTTSNCPLINRQDIQFRPRRSVRSVQRPAKRLMDPALTDPVRNYPQQHSQSKSRHPPLRTSEMASMIGPGSRRGRALHKLQRQHHQTQGDVEPGGKGPAAQHHRASGVQF